MLFNSEVLDKCILGRNVWVDRINGCKFLVISIEVYENYVYISLKFRIVKFKLCRIKCEVFR